MPKATTSTTKQQRLLVRLALLQQQTDKTVRFSTGASQTLIDEERLALEAEQLLPEPPELLSPRQAAVIWGVNDRRAREFCEDARVPGALRLGSAHAIPLDAVLEFAQRPRPSGNPNFRRPEPATATKKTKKTKKTTKKPTEKG